MSKQTVKAAIPELKEIAEQLGVAVNNSAVLEEYFKRHPNEEVYSVRYNEGETAGEELSLIDAKKLCYGINKNAQEYIAFAADKNGKYVYR